MYFQTSSKEEKTVPTDLGFLTKIENCVIKGYHSFKIRPPITDPVTMLTVDREYTNIHDVNSCFVWIPPLRSFSTDLHGMVTDEKRGLRLDGVARLLTGHVRKGLAGCFRQIMDSGDILCRNVW